MEFTTTTTTSQSCRMNIDMVRMMRVGSGGRYDHLTAKLGKAEPAIGFVIDLDALTDVMLARNGQEPEAQAEATMLRVTSNDSLTTFQEAIAARWRGERVLISPQEVKR